MAEESNFKNLSDDTNVDAVDNAAESLSQLSLTRNDNSRRPSRTDNSSSRLRSSTLSTPSSSPLRFQYPRNDIVVYNPDAQLLFPSDGGLLGPAPTIPRPECVFWLPQVAGMWQRNSTMINNDYTSFGQMMPCFPRQSETPLGSVSNQYHALFSYPYPSGMMSYNPVQGGSWPRGTYSDQFYQNPVRNDHASLSTVRGQDYPDRNLYTNNNEILESCIQELQLSDRLPENKRRRLAGRAWDEARCSLLIDRLSLGDQNEIGTIFAKVRGEFARLAADSVGGGLIRKLIDVVDEDKLDEIVALVTNPNDLNTTKYICSDDYGKMVMMSLVERLKGYEDKQWLLMSGLSRVAVYLTTKTNCKPALEYCFSSFSYKALQPLLEQVAASLLEIAINKNGSCAIERCLTLCFVHNDKKTFDAFVACVVEYLADLYDCRFGSYIVQFLIGIKNPIIIHQLTEKLKGHFGSLSMNRACSNVIRNLIECSERDTAEKIIVDIAKSPNLLRFLQHKHGNFVAQSALKESKRLKLPVHQKLYDFVMDNFDSLITHFYGKNVLLAIEGERSSNTA